MSALATTLLCVASFLMGAWSRPYLESKVKSEPLRLMIAIAIIASCGAVMQRVHYLTDCITTVVAEGGQSTTERSEAAVNRDAAVDKIFNLRLSEDAPVTDSRVQAALAKYNRASAELRTVRRDNPTPNIRDYCKENAK